MKQLLTGNHLYRHAQKPLSVAAIKIRRAEGGGIAPNIFHLVRKAMDEHPEVNRMDDVERGKIIDYAANEANGPGKAKPWGRKSRQRPGENLMPVNPNGDGLTYLRPDGDFEIYDVISGGDGNATWDFAGVFKQGENGYWARAYGSPEPVIETHRYIGGGNDTGTCDQCGLPKVNDVHRVPEGKVKHKPWQGEDGKGDCDLCFQPVGAPIHEDVIDPPIEDPDDPDPPDSTELAQLAKELHELRDQFDAKVEAKVKDALLNIEVLVTVKKAGPIVQVPRALQYLNGGQREINLSHDHPTEVQLKLYDKVIRTE